MQTIGMIKQGEFDHPNIAPGNILCRHVLYKIENKSCNESNIPNNWYETFSQALTAKCVNNKWLV